MGRRPASATLGELAEAQALELLRRAGLRLLARNFRARGGELDLVMLDCDCVVFVEVRCRSSARFSTPAETVDRHKQRRIVRTAALFLARHAAYARRPVRFDVVGIIDADSPAPRCEWLRDAFRPGDSRL